LTETTDFFIIFQFYNTTGCPLQQQQQQEQEQQQQQQQKQQQQQIVYTLNFLTGSKYCAVYLVAGSVLLFFYFFKIIPHIRSAFVKPPSYLQAKSTNAISQLCRLVELPSANATANERGTFVCSHSNSGVLSKTRRATREKRRICCCCCRTV
jgi:hypothetical protein